IKEERADARVGIAQNIVDVEPARTRASDMDAVRDWDSFMHRRLLELAISSGSLDFLGINYYTRIFVTKLPLPGVPLKALPGYAEVEKATGPWLFRLLGGRRGDRARTDMGWEVVPEGFERVIRSYWQAYKVPIVITENGVADGDGTRREAYLVEHLAALHRAMAAGARVRGYLHWTLVDNYEWGSYTPKFGLFHVDRKKGFERRPAAGADLYARVAETGELPEPAVRTG
ncbi:MAG: family 1 glycosylhydrolase, partial [Elusimicrobia bacterium]|nr:family 1 glycosylhydrolase [Elusimicrobiota bacterium]